MTKLETLQAQLAELLLQLENVAEGEDAGDIQGEIDAIQAEIDASVTEMETIALSEDEELSDEDEARWNTLNTKVQKLISKRERIVRAEELTKLKATQRMKPIETNETPMSVQFRDFLKGAVEEGKTKTFRADPILTSTQTGVINKTVANSVDILTSPAEAFLRSIGVTFYTGLNGNFVVPALAQDTAAFVGEDASAASADMAHEALTLAARRVTHTQSITRETLAQTNPAIYQSILQNLVNGVWNAVTNDVFDTLQTDAATSETTPTNTGLTYADIVKMEASIGGLDIGTGTYVTTPTIKAFLKQKAVLGTDNGPIWSNDNTVNGYPAYGVPAANATSIYFGDFSRMAVGNWTGLEVIVDELTQAKQGRINLTIVGLFDTGCTNKRAFCWTNDVSAGL